MAEILEIQDSAFSVVDSVKETNKKSECKRSDFTAPLYRKIEIRAKTITQRVEIINCSAASEIEIAVNPKRKIICSGSFIAVLNRIIESAPTNPKLNAKDDLMVVIIKKIEIEKNKKLEANKVLLEVTKA
jgi:hypothetical protein